MAAILPGSPPSFNKADAAGTVKALCDYTRSMHENIDFMLGQLKKEMAAAGNRLDSLSGTASSLGKEVSGLQGSVSGLQGSVSGLTSQLNALAQRVSALEQRSN